MKSDRLRAPMTGLFVATLWIAACLLLTGVCADARAVNDHMDALFYYDLEQGDISILPDFRAHAAALSWPIYYHIAGAIYHYKPDQEAVMWLYTGKFRAHIASRFDPNPRASAALTEMSDELVGRPINAFAGSDKDLWLRAIDAAIAWTKANPYSVAQLQADLDGRTVGVTTATMQGATADSMTDLMKLRDTIAETDPAELK